MIRIKCGDIYHHGIFVSVGEVIEFGAPPARRENISEGEVRVRSVTLSDFLGGLSFEVALFSPAERALMPTADEAISAARSRIGKGGYNIIHNNCQHFATECVTGKRCSEQGDEVRNKIRSLPVLHVYLAEIPKDAPMPPLSHEERQRELNIISNDRVKREKYFAWRLLEYALYRSFGKRIEEAGIYRSESGRWLCPDLHLSISHTDGAVAVALSRTPVGVDIEKPSPHSAEKYAKKILTPEEYALYLDTPVENRTAIFTEYWCKKESIFKMKDDPALTVGKIDTRLSPTLVRHMTVGGCETVLAVASDITEKTKFFDNIDLSVI